MTLAAAFQATATTFARTKIQPPQPRGGAALERPVLVARLRRALQTSRVVLVSAAAGYGKTATLARAVSSLPGDHGVAWVSIDPGDDLPRILECLTAALEPLDPPWRTAPEGLVAAARQPGGAHHQVIADELVNTLDACELVHGVIVLDDFHHVDEPAALAFVDHLISRLTARWTVVLAARHDPPLRLARWRAADELAEFREGDLRFDLSEVRALVAAAAGGGGDSGDQLFERTAGWPAGVRLGLSGARGVATARPGSIDRQAFEYLATEVVDRLEPPLREFLLATSVLPVLDAARCAAVSGDAQAARWLHEIERRALFVTVVDDRGPTLKLHDLMRDALQHRMATSSPGRRRELLLRAAEVEPDPRQRVTIWLDAAQYERAARELLEQAQLMVVQGAVQIALQLARRFPADFTDASAELQLMLAMASWTVWDNQAMAGHAERAEALYRRRGERDGAERAQAHRVIALIGLGRIDEAGRAVAPLLRDSAGSSDAARALTLVAAGYHLLETGALHRVAPVFDELVSLLERHPQLEFWYTTVPPPRTTSLRGMFPALTRWASGVLAVSGDQPIPLRTSALITRSWVALWQGRLSDVEEALAQARSDAVWTGPHHVARSHMLAIQAVYDAFCGRHAAALDAMRTRLAEHPAGYGHWGLWLLLHFAGRVAMVCGDAAALREWTARMRALEPDLPDRNPERRLPQLPLLASLAWLEGRRDEAIALWQEALAHEERIDMLGLAVDARLGLARALLRSGAADHAAAALRPVFERARLDGGPGGALLAGDALRELAQVRWPQLTGDESARLAEWAALAVPHRPAGAAAGNRAATGPHERLSPRERDVLAAIAAGDSNKVIARSLELSPHTVKRHVANILDKLALTSRGQAAAWHRANA